MREKLTGAMSMILEKKRVLPEYEHLSLRPSQVKEFMEIFFREMMVKREPKG